jgi:hypothetical protein
MAGHAGVSWIRPEGMWVKRGLIGRQSAEIKDLQTMRVCKYCRQPEYQAVVNHDFMLG